MASTIISKEEKKVKDSSTYRINFPLSWTIYDNREKPVVSQQAFRTS